MGENSPVFLTILLALCASTARGAEPVSERGSPVVVELFSSQACSSCVAASELVTEFADRSDVVALSWHVDYWNTLQTKSGRWVDPYSDEKCTKRQKLYNKKIRRRSTVYTPQMIINGDSQAVGSKREKIERLIAKAREEATPAAISATRAGEKLSFAIAGVNGEAEAHLVTFKRRVKTKISRGENAGLMYQDANVVTSIEKLGAVANDGAEFGATAPGEGDHCALIIQEPDQGRIIAASYCAET